MDGWMYFHQKKKNDLKYLKNNKQKRNKNFGLFTFQKIINQSSEYQERKKLNDSLLESSIIFQVGKIEFGLNSTRNIKIFFK
jgi:hypothetical protein